MALRDSLLNSMSVVSEHRGIESTDSSRAFGFSASVDSAIIFLGCNFSSSFLKPADVTRRVFVSFHFAKPAACFGSPLSGRELLFDILGNVAL